MSSGPNGSSPNGSTAVCVLVEGSYFHGMAVLLNSLIRSGFVGELIVGYRGDLPPWLVALHGNGSSASSPVAEHVTLRLVSITSDWHLTNLKAAFMQQIFDEINPDLQVLFYFDADILVNCAWANFERWVRHGVVLVLDMAETYMPAQHAFRREWSAMAERCGRTSRAVNGYVNGGCVGLSRAHIEIVRVWGALMARLHSEGLDMRKIVAPDGMPEYAKMDQDILNAAVMATDVPLSLLGVEAMDIFPSANIMTHYMIFSKPWRRRYIVDALKGFPPSRNEWYFWNLVNNPVQSMTPSELRAARRRLKIARLIGHVRRRGLRE